MHLFYVVWITYFIADIPIRFERVEKKANSSKSVQRII